MKCFTTIGVAWAAVLCVAPSTLADNIWQNPGSIGIGTGNVADEYMLYIVQSDDNASRVQNGVNIDLDVSGSPVGNRYSKGLFVEVTSSASGSQSGNTQQLFGSHNKIVVNGETYTAQASHNSVYNDSSNTIGFARPNYNYIRNQRFPICLEGLN